VMFKSVTCQKYCFIHTPSGGDTTLRTNPNKITFLGQKRTFWHNFSTLLHSSVANGGRGGARSAPGGTSMGAALWAMQQA